MRTIQASEAKTHLPQLLDEVERGETLVITRHGRAIARIVPESNRRQEEIDRAVSEIQVARKKAGKRAGAVSVRQILAARDEGRK
jgi:prevent-host-death family protein